MAKQIPEKELQDIEAVVSAHPVNASAVVRFHLAFPPAVLLLGQGMVFRRMPMVGASETCGV